MKTNKRQRLILVCLLFASIAIGVILILTNFNDNIIFFYTPSQLKNKNNIIRIGGLVKTGSLIKSDLDVEFIITDLKAEIKVKYHGLLPTLFREGQGTVTKGKFKNDYFIADEILAKHDEKYMPQEVIDAIKNSGQWRP